MDPWRAPDWVFDARPEVAYKVDRLTSSLADFATLLARAVIK